MKNLRDLDKLSQAELERNKLRQFACYEYNWFTHANSRRRLRLARARVDMEEQEQEDYHDDN